MNYKETFDFWCNDPNFDSDTKNELLALNDEKEIEDRFYKELEFGTSGLRGIMGAGTNRINRYTVGKATLALSRFLEKHFINGKEKGVVIAFDTRKNSAMLSRCAADILTNRGFRVFLFSMPCPTPVLSFAVREFNAVSGIVLTASHNPVQYNGYKAYNQDGCQLDVDASAEVMEFASKISFSEIDFDGNDSLLSLIGKEIIEKFENEVLKQSVISDRNIKNSLKIVYSPIHGTGLIPVSETLIKDGFTNVFIVPEQKEPDGSFPTVKSPNPEEKDTLRMGMELCEKLCADIVIATDPDADRMGSAVRTKDGMKLLTGNQQGALIFDFLLKTKTVVGKNPVLIKSIVTGDLTKAIAEKNGIELCEVLTGFRFIGEKITCFEEERKKNLPTAHSFLFGFEESYGYLSGTHTRDKDSVVASLLFCEMAAFYKANGKTLIDAMDEIYSEYGYYHDSQKSYVFSGKDGHQKIDEIMEIFRNDHGFIRDIESILDFQKGIDGFPKSNVFKIILKNSGWITVRPSGTEPKIKIYFSLHGKTKEEVEQKFEYYLKEIENRIGV